MKESLEFYNQFDEKLIKDYTNGNKRIISAIINLSRYIPSNTVSILDVGCGIGWSSYEFSKHFFDAHVTGIDLSPVLIDKATMLFTNKNLDYKVFDITKKVPENTYNAVIMIDVYEHIPINKRQSFHESIKQLLSKQGRLILACPSKYHQGYLKKNNPDGLQPVDEDVDFGVIQTLAEDVDGEVIYYSYQNIWRNHDYLYAVIEKQFKYNRSVGFKQQIKQVESKKDRINRVNSKLGYSIKYSSNNKYSLSRIFNFFLKKFKL